VPNEIKRTLGGKYYRDSNINKEFLFEKAGFYLLYVEADEPIDINVSFYTNHAVSMEPIKNKYIDHKLINKLIKAYKLPKDDSK